MTTPDVPPDDHQPPPLPSHSPPPLPPPESDSGPVPPPIPSFPPMGEVGQGIPQPIVSEGITPPLIADNSNMYGIASLVVGGISLPISGCCSIFCFPFGFIGLIGAAIGILLAVLGMRAARQAGRSNTLCTFGLILSIFVAVICVGALILMTFVIVSGRTSSGGF